MSSHILRPSGSSTSFDHQLTLRPSCLSATAVFDSLPPTRTSSVSAISILPGPGGLRRSIVSPKVTTSNEGITLDSLAARQGNYRNVASQPSFRTAVVRNPLFTQDKRAARH